MIIADLMMMMIIEFLLIQCNRQETIRSFCLPDFMVIVFCPAINQRLQSFKVVRQSYALTGCFNLIEAVQPNSRGSVSVSFINRLRKFYSLDLWLDFVFLQ